MIAVIKYNAGNIRSVENALNRIGASCVVTDNIEEIQKAEKVILPGVGEASTAMEYLKSKKLDVVLKNLKQPVLGICLGLQLMCDSSEEGDKSPPDPKGGSSNPPSGVGGQTTCLGIFDTNVKLFPPKEIVPQMGWNGLTHIKGSLFKGVTENDDMYFVHSYYAELCEDTAAICDYIVPFSAAFQKNNFFATQFHPEKSGAVGEIILKNFLKTTLPL